MTDLGIGQDADLLTAPRFRGSEPSQEPRKVAVVPGDEAAAEAMLATMELLYALDLPVDWEVRDPGVSLPPEEADAADSVLFGSTNGTTKALEYLRYGWGTYANVRPIKWWPGARSVLKEPAGIDYVIVRECMEDSYVAIEGPISELADAGIELVTPYEKQGFPRKYKVNTPETYYCLKVVTEDIVRRTAHFAASLAERRKAQGFEGRVTIGCKWNAHPVTDQKFRDIAEEAIAEHPGIECNAFFSDDMGCRMIARPQQFDVVLVPNFLGDLLSDVAAGSIGGLGMAPSGGYGDDRAYFEPAHGTAPDLFGTGRINPVATIISASMMLDYLALPEAAERVRTGVGTVLGKGEVLTADLGGSSSCVDFVQAVTAEATA